VITAAGAAFRLFHLTVVNRSLWLDECMLALNVAARGFAELLEPLDYNQAAPVLFLMLERLLVAAAGVSEASLRALPTLAGIALVPLAWAVARRLSGPMAAALSASLVAVSPALVRFANEAKPYGTDAFATLLLVWAALRLRPGPGATRDRLVLAGLGCGAVLLSFPALFSAGAVTAALALRTRGERRQLGVVLACALCWLGSAAVPYLLVHRGVAASAAQQEGYEKAFLIAGPDIGERALLAVRGTLLPAFHGNGSTIPPAPSVMPAIVGALAIGGGIAMILHSGLGAGVLIFGPLALAVAASGLRRYPVGVPRLMVFWVPLLIVATAAGAAAVSRLAGGRLRGVAAAALAVLILGVPLASSVAECRNPYRGEDARTLLAEYRSQRRGEEPVYVSAKGIPSWLFYTTNWENPDRERLGYYARAAGSGPSFENAPPRGHPVVDEGRDLVFRRRGRMELLGIATGRQWRWPSYAGAIDPGWAANEARRVVAAIRENPAGNPCAWLYFTRLSERSAKPVTWQLRDGHGAFRDGEIGVPGGVMYRYCLPLDPADVVGLPDAPVAQRLRQARQPPDEDR
jgi:hypothetical protein